jgi:hypothetical protein
MPVVTFTRFEVRRMLALPNIPAVDALVEARILVPTCYDARVQGLFELHAIHRAAAHVFGTSDPLEQLKRKYAAIPGAAEAKTAAFLVDALCKEKKYREGGDDRLILDDVLSDPLLKALYAR